MKEEWWRERTGENVGRGEGNNSMVGNGWGGNQLIEKSDPLMWGLKLKSGLAYRGVPRLPSRRPLRNAAFLPSVCRGASEHLSPANAQPTANFWKQALSRCSCGLACFVFVMCCSGMLMTIWVVNVDMIVNVHSHRSCSVPAPLPPRSRPAPAAPSPQATAEMVEFCYDML